MVKTEKELRESYKTSDLVADIVKSVAQFQRLAATDETRVCKTFLKVLKTVEERYEAQTEMAGKRRQRFKESEGKQEETKVNTQFAIRL